MKRSAALLIASALAAAAALLRLARSSAPPGRQVVLITGGSRGLGLALARRFARDRAQLILIARDPAELERARDQLLAEGAIATPQDALLIPADLTHQPQAAAVIQQALAQFGRIDVLVNNAGIITAGPIENQSLATFHRTMNTNFFAALHMVQAALPSMLTRFQTHGERSSIVNISSIGGKFAMPHLLPYVASKFALTGFSEGLHAELRHQGIRVTTVCPGLMRTGSHVQAEFTGNRDAEYRWFALGATTPGLAATTRHAANRIVDAVRTGRAEITITPQAWLAARANGLAPETTQHLAALVNHLVLPAPVSQQAAPTQGRHLNQPQIPLFEDNSTNLQLTHNQA